MLLAETHCHTAEVSLCAKVPAREVPALYKEKGYGAIIVTDHYNRWTLESLASGRKRQIEKWLDGWRFLREAGEAIDVRAFLGMELALTQGPEDFLIYGIDESFLFRHPKLVDGTLKTAFRIVEEEGLLLYQAHPCRSGIQCAPAELLHGVEAFNGNPRQANNNGCAAAFAARHNLKRIAGSDFHQTADAGRGGIWLPEDIRCNPDLIGYLKMNEPKLYMRNDSAREVIGT